MESHLSVLALLVCSTITFADEGKIPPPVAETAPSSDTTFEILGDRVGIQGILEFPVYFFYLGAPNLHGVGYWPNFGPRIGPKISWKGLGLAVTLPLPIPEVEQNRRGNSRLTEIILSSYRRQLAFDVYYQKIKGFYASSPLTEFNAHKPERYPQLPDAQGLNYGINFYYVLNPSRFSLKAGFDQDEFQTKSGGSWILSPFYNHFELSLGTRYIPGIEDSSIVEIPNLTTGRFDSVGATMGYGYTYIDGRFFASTILGAGSAAQFQRLQRTDQNNTSRVSAALKINLNLAMGWNYKTYVGGFKLLLDSLSSNVSGTEVASNLCSAQIFFGGRL